MTNLLLLAIVRQGHFTLAANAQRWLPLLWGVLGMLMQRGNSGLHVGESIALQTPELSPNVGYWCVRRTPSPRLNF